MDKIHILFRRAQPKINIKETISGVRKAYKTQKQEQKSEDVFQKLNNTIHKAAPLIEYAVDALSEKLSKKKESTIHPSLLFETTSFIYKSLEESPIHTSSTFKKSLKNRFNFDDDLFDKNNCSSQNLMLAIIAVGVILIVMILLITRLFLTKNPNEIRHQKNREIQETDSVRRSIRSTVSSP